MVIVRHQRPRPNEKLGLGDSAGHGLPSNTASATHRSLGADEHPGACEPKQDIFGKKIGPSLEV